MSNPDDLQDLVPDVDRFPAHYIPIIRERLNRFGVGAGVMQDEAAGWSMAEFPRIVEERWGKLDSQLNAGSTATVSLWCDNNYSWLGWDQDSGQNWDDVYAPPLLTSGSIASGKWVLVRNVNGRKVVVAAEC